MTGGCGFIASNFVNYFLKENSSSRIINYDILTSASDKRNIDSSLVTPHNYLLVEGDIRNSKLLQRVLSRYGVDTVVHFAAETHVQDSFETPLDFVKVNVEGTVTLLNECLSYGKLKRFIYISTDEVYGDSSEGTCRPKTEQDEPAPTNPYAASKASAEHFVNVFHKSYNFPAVTVRMCNAYGPMQSREKLIPKFIQLAAEGKPFTIQGDGKQKRSFLYVTDICSAICKVMQLGIPGQVYNIGTFFEISVSDVAKAIQMAVNEATGRPPNDNVMLVKERDRPYNDRRYYMDSSKLRTELKWQECVSWKDGLKQTVSWYLTESQLKADREKILVFGANGWIGGQFVMLLQREGVEYVVSKSRLGDDSDDTIESEILSATPTHVACFIGRTHGPGNNTIDYLEGGPDKLAINMRDNLYGPLLLAELCRKFNIHLTYIGSGCIFKYDDEHSVNGKPFDEEDIPNYFGSSYSVVKGYTDRAMHQYDNVLNVRMRMPISHEKNPRNLITKITSYKKILNLPNSVTVLPELLPILLELMKKRETGTLNLVNHGCMEHTDILEAYKKEIDPSHAFEMIADSDKSNFADKLRSSRSNCYLSTDRLASLTHEVTPAKEAVKKAIENYQ